MTWEPIVAIEGLVKSYGSIEAVRGIDLHLEKGEVFGFLGPNGAGKTTTIRCLMGLLQPSAGTIQAFGLDVAQHGVSVRQRVSYVPGELRLPERMTGNQLVATVGSVRGHLDVHRRDELAARLGIDLSRPVRDLSTGNRRKLALLLAFVDDVELLVLDEPTSGLDPLMQREFLSLVAEAKARGATVLLSSHVLSEVQRAADRVAVLRRGEVIARGSVGDLRKRARQRAEIWFDGEAPVEAIRNLPGVDDVAAEGSHVSATLTGHIQPLLDVLAGARVASMLLDEPDLEDAFLELYRDPER